MQTLQDLFNNINPETADTIINRIYGINGFVKEDLFYIYNKQPQFYSKVLSTIYDFINSNCSAKNVNEMIRDGGIGNEYMFGLNVLFNRAIFINYLSFKDNVEEMRKFFTEKKDFLIMIANHPDLQFICDYSQSKSNDVKFMIYNNLRVFNLIKPNEIPNIIPDDKELYSIELINSEQNQSYTRIQNAYLSLRGCNSVSKYKKMINGIFINTMMLRQDGSLEQFILDNLSVLSSEGAIYVSDNEGSDKEMFATVLAQNLTNDDDSQLLGAVGRRDKENVSIAELIMEEFNINKMVISGNSSIETVISDLYNKGFPVSIRGNKIDYTKLKFANADIEKDFLTRNIDIMPFNDIPLIYRLRMLYENSDIFFAKAVPSIELLKAIDINRIPNNQIGTMDVFISKFGDEKFKIEIYKKFYETKKIVLEETVRSLSKEGVQTLIDYNTDIPVEEKLLGIFKSKSDDGEFAETYLGNILKEASATNQDYMFDYNKIISEIGRGKQPLEAINIMLSTKAFQSIGDMKAYRFVSYLIGKQTDENNMLGVIETFFNLKSSMNLEFFNIIAKQLVSEFLHKKNVLPGAIKTIEDSVHEFMGILGKEDKPSLANRFVTFFKGVSDFETLSSVRTNEEKIDKVKLNGDKLIQTLLTKYQTNLDFIVKYKEYFEPSFYTQMIATLEESKKRILTLQQTLKEV